MKINAHALGLTLGVVWGAAALIVGLTALWFDYGSAVVELIGTVYVGYDATFGGAIIGGIWGFIDAYIGGAIVGWLYNSFSKKNQ